MSEHTITILQRELILITMKRCLQLKDTFKQDVFLLAEALDTTEAGYFPEIFKDNTLLSLLCKVLSRQELSFEARNNTHLVCEVIDEIKDNSISYLYKHYTNAQEVQEYLLQELSDEDD